MNIDFSNQEVLSKVGRAHPLYSDNRPLWQRMRKAIEGERSVKRHDASQALSGVVSADNVNTFLVPFSPGMDAKRWLMYIREAEFPGITAQFLHSVVGGILRTGVSITINENAGDVNEGNKTDNKKIPEGEKQRIVHWAHNILPFGDKSIVAFMYDLLQEELTTGWTWIGIDYSAKQQSPIMRVWPAERVINWQFDYHPKTGKHSLVMLVTAYVEESLEEGNPFDPKYYSRVDVHFIDDAGIYRVGRLKAKTAVSSAEAPPLGETSDSERIVDHTSDTSMEYELDELVTPLVFEEPMEFIPFFQARGLNSPKSPPLLPLIEREIGLYNIIARRNHLMLGAATYTPIIAGNISDEDFERIVSNGLGTWLNIGPDARVDVLSAPVDVLSYMQSAIEQSMSDIAKLGVRILAPEVAQSGVALELRNAAPVAMLSALNSSVTETMQKAISAAVYWKTGRAIAAQDITITMSNDFGPTPRGLDWLSMVIDLYDKGIIPVKVLVNILKANDIIPESVTEQEIIQHLEQSKSYAVQGVGGNATPGLSSDQSLQGLLQGLGGN